MSLDISLASLLKNPWSLLGLIGSVPIALAFGVAINQIIPDGSYSALILTAIVWLSWIGLWVHKSRIPSPKPHQYSIAVCISSVDRDVENEFRTHVLENLANSLKIGTGLEAVSVHSIPSHISARLGKREAAIKKLSGAGYDMIIFGTVVKLNGVARLQIDAQVRHASLVDESKKRLQSEINGAWNPNVEIRDSDKSFQLYELLVEELAISSKYIIGLALFASSEYELSIPVFEALRNELTKASIHSSMTRNAIKRNLSKYLNIAYVSQASDILNEWYINPSSELEIEFCNVTSKIYGSYKTNEDVLHFSAIAEVLANNSYHYALILLNKIGKKKRGAIWNLNAGFIYACMGDDGKLVSCYNTAATLSLSDPSSLRPETACQIEGFILTYQRMHTRPLLKFCLGYINHKFKNDLLVAKEDYNEFLVMDVVDSYPKAKRTAEQNLKYLN